MVRRTKNTSPYLDPRMDIKNEYGRVSKSGQLTKLKARFDVYDYARIGANDILANIYGQLALAGSETVLDIGCAKGTMLAKYFGKLLGHRGPLIGLDINHEVLKRGQQENPNVSFVQGNAQSIGLRTQSANIAFSLFTLYHVPQPEAALSEIKRVLRPDGLAVIATSGPDNKQRHRSFEQRVANYLGVAPPIVYSEPFDATVAERLLPEKFDILYRGYQKDHMVFTRSSMKVYLGSLATMYTTCQPHVPQNVWTGAIQKIVVPEIRQEIADSGEFTDTIDRRFYLCSPLESK